MMKAYDKVHKEDLEVTNKSLIDLMVIKSRQIDLVLPTPKTDPDRYLTWDTEHWTAINPRKFIRCYSLKGRVLRDSTGHNDYDLRNDFYPEKAAEIFIT